MYTEIEAKSFLDVARGLRAHQRIKVKVYSHSDSWGHRIARYVQDIFLTEHRRENATLVYAIFDKREVIEEDDMRSWFYMSLANTSNSSVISHAKLTCFKEEEIK